VTTDGSYEFNLLSDDQENRFNLIFTAATAQSSESRTKKEDWKLYYFDQHILISGLQEDSSVEIYTLSGQLVEMVTVRGSGVDKINVSKLTAGSYLVRGTSKNEVLTGKVIIR
jgi:hypothetical protein